MANLKTPRSKVIKRQPAANRLRPATETRDVKYVFLDVVSFSKDRSAEAQADIVTALNRIVSAAAGSVPSRIARIFLPTGDGVCVCIIDPRSAYDAHLTLALDVHRLIAEYNRSTTDKARQFKVRIGLSENVDALVKDINGRRNVAGAGINTAQRVMNVGDGGHIFVDDIVYMKLCHREKYAHAFRHFYVPIKGQQYLQVHQFVTLGHRGLDPNPPKALAEPTERQLTLIEGYYLAHAISLEGVIGSSDSSQSYAAVVMLYMLALDSVESATHVSVGYNAPRIKVYGKGKKAVNEIFNYYRSVDFCLTEQMSSFVKRALLGCADFLDMYFLFVSKEGRAKLERDHPEIFKQILSQ